MQRKSLITILVALAVAAALVIAALPAASWDTRSVAGMSAADMPDLAAMAMPKAVMMTVNANDMADGNMTFAIPHGARVQPVGKTDIAIVATYNKPLTEKLDTSTGTGTISIDGALPATATIDYANRSAIPVAGANAVVILQDFALTGIAMEKGDIDFEVGSVAVYLPDGTVKAMKPDRPVRMSVSLDQMMLRGQTSPAFARMMAGTIKSGDTFPAGAEPVPLNDILAAI